MAILRADANAASREVAMIPVGDRGLNLAVLAVLASGFARLQQLPRSFTSQVPALSSRTLPQQ